MMIGANFFAIISIIIIMQVEMVCRNRPCLNDIIQAYRTCGRGVLSIAISNCKLQL